MGSTHKKLGKMADNNAKKAKVFSKLAKLISMEAKKAGGNLSSPGLKAAIDKARKENMPSDNIERAIKKLTAQKWFRYFLNFTARAELEF